jgi:capsular polysaccharide biosynthesis protein
VIYFKKIFMRQLLTTSNSLTLHSLVFIFNLVSTNDKKLSAKKVKFLDQLEADRKVLLPAVSAKTYLPNYTTTKNYNFVEVTCPEVQLLKFDNFTISASCTSFIKANELYIERYANEQNSNAVYDSGCIFSHNNKYALVRQSDLDYIEKGFFLAGNGSYNYYHWLIEILPKLQFYLELGLHDQGIKLLVPETVKENENLSFLLTSVLGDIEVEIVYVSYYFGLCVKHLYHLTPINNILFNERKIGLTANTLHLRYDSLAFIRSKIECDVPLHDIKTSKVERIFLARKNKGVRSYNQSEIIQLLTKYNFKIIYMEDYDIKQQIFLFKNAKYIVGASGAAWTNLIFCNRLCKALTWLPESIKKFPAFSTLANFANVELTFFTTESKHYNNMHDRYIIDLDFLELQLQKLLA